MGSRWDTHTQGGITETGKDELHLKMTELYMKRLRSWKSKDPQWEKKPNSTVKKRFKSTPHKWKQRGEEKKKSLRTRMKIWRNGFNDHFKQNLRFYDLKCLVYKQYYIILKVNMTRNTSRKYISSSVPNVIIHINKKSII